MITGAVQSDEARIRLKVKGRRGREQEVEAVIDSGFTGALTLPPALITTLGLRWRSVDHATLADGSTCVFHVYVASSETAFRHPRRPAELPRARVSGRQVSGLSCCSSRNRSMLSSRGGDRVAVAPNELQHLPAALDCRSEWL
jgi:hypothetical protein